ncbi:hypothetical protein [Loktanella sp. Alg231-35]|uniref:hypothetical protein n=1 Tax=Loktanella sp. Alg231-35 TaxID=1922220 RepID=UPI000D554C09|nr:hypothetical protein [Loktanella sp. Alg231-35]
MPFEWPTADEMMYRVARLRRLVALAVMVPVIVLFVAASIDPISLPADRATLAAVAMAVLVVGHIALFPNVTLETISLSLSVSFLVISVPWIKAVAQWAPAEHASAALVILIVFAVALTGVVMAILQIGLNALVYAGPALRLRLKTTLFVPCSPTVAHRQCAMQPQTRRGRVLTGQADEDGFFDVAVVAPHHSDPEQPDHPLIVKLVAKVLESTPEHHDVMMVLQNGSVTVTSQRFTAVDGGCQIAVSDMPGDFTLGMHAMFWLTDQQADNLTETTDVIIGQEARANGLAHGVSLLSVAGTLLSPQTPVVDRAK